MHDLSRCRIIVAVVMGLCVITTFSSAQPSVAASQPQIDRYARSVLAKRITVHLDDASLESAVDAIAARAGVRLQYQLSLLEAAKMPVAVHADDRSLGEVFEDLLAVHNLQLMVSGRNMLTIVATKAPLLVKEGIVVIRVVHAKTNQPIPAASVFTKDGTKKGDGGGNGVLRLKLDVGEHELTVRAVGFLPQRRRVVVEENAEHPMEFVLEPGVRVLDDVIVTGSVIATERRAIATPITVITAEELQSRGITRIEQLFRGEVPGVLARDKGMLGYYGGTPGLDQTIGLGQLQSSEIYSRGSSKLGDFGDEPSPTPLKTYVDGVELVDPSYLGTIDPQSIERIEIVTGPQAATIYGSGAMGGVMQIFTKKGRFGARPEFSLRLRYGVLQNSLSTGRTPTHNHGLTMSGGSGPTFTYTATASYNYTGQWQPFLFARSHAVSLGASHIAGPFVVDASFSTSGGNNGTTSGSGNTNSPLARQLVLTGEWWESDVTRRLPPSQRVSTAQSQTASLNLNYRPGSFWQHSLSVGKSQTEFGIVPEQPRFKDAEDTLMGTGGSTGNRTSVGYTISILPLTKAFVSSTLSVGVNKSFGQTFSAGGCFLSPAAAAYSACDQFRPVAVQRPPESSSWGGFGSWRLGLFDRLYLTLGLRGERNRNYGSDRKTDWTPTNGLAYNIAFGDVSIKLLASYGKATRPPNANMRLERTVITSWYIPSTYIDQLANPDLRPEYSRGPQGGMEIYLGNRGSISVNRYKQKISDLIHTVYADSIQIINTIVGREVWIDQTQYANIATIASHGWESTGSLRLGALSLRGTYSWMDSRIAEVNEKMTAFHRYTVGSSFGQMPTHSGSVQVAYAINATSVTLVSNWVGSAAYAANNHPMGMNLRSSRLRHYQVRNAFPTDISWNREGYIKSDLSVQHRVKSWASATLHVTNVGNSFDADQMWLYPSLGRQTQMGLSLQFPRR